MKEKILRKLYLAFIRVHILRHGAKGEFYGAWLMEHIKNHGYNMSPGTIYPLLNKMCEEGLLVKEERNVEGKIRKYYKGTELGVEVLKLAEKRIEELSRKKVK